MTNEKKRQVSTLENERILLGAKSFRSREEQSFLDRHISTECVIDRNLPSNVDQQFLPKTACHFPKQPLAFQVLVLVIS